jgi:tetraacyldisaccharide 4'-kinase
MKWRASLRRLLLQGPAWVYELSVRLRIAAYETRYLKPRRLEAVVISVGNITLGGTGKTPLVDYIARYLSQEGYSVAILSRGYARKSRGQIVLNGRAEVSPVSEKGTRPPGSQSYRETGDEPLLLARSVPQVPVIINKDRFEGGIWAERCLGSQVLILDDGYQHLSLARDLNLLVLDATDPFGGFRMVPFGRLREPLYGIKRADAVIVTRAHRPFDQGQLGAIIKYFCGERIPVMYAYSTITGLRHLESGTVYDADEFNGWNARVMCGIGNPRAFVDDLVGVGISVLGESLFRDHYPYSQKDADQVTAQARAAGADLIVTTEKDAIRLAGLKWSDVPVYAAQSEIQTDDEVRLKSLLLRALVVKR